MSPSIRCGRKLTLLGIAIVISVLYGQVTTAQVDSGARPVQSSPVERLSDDHLELATRTVQPAVGDVRDLPWMSGVVSIEVVVDETGHVVEARALFGASALIGPGEAAAKQWVFRPFIVNGMPRRVRTAIRFNASPLPPGIDSRNFGELVQKELLSRPHSALAFYNAGYAYDMFGNRHEEAIAYLQKALALRPNWALARYEIGHAYYGLERYEQAIEAFERALEIDPSMADAALEIGWCHDRMESRTDSAAAFSRAAQLAKSAQGRLEALQNLTESHARAGRMRESADARLEMVREMRRFVGVVPGNYYDVPRQAYDVAKSYEAIGETRHMAEAFRLAMETDGTSYFSMLSRMELADFLNGAGRGVEATGLFESALAILDDSESGPSVARDSDTLAMRHYWRGWALLGLGRRKEALGEAKRAVELRSDWDRARVLLDRVNSQLGGGE